MQNLAINYEMQRKWDAANKMLDRGLAITPTAFGLMEIKCKVAIEERGDLSLGEKFLDNVDSSQLSPEIQGQITAGRAQMFILQRKFGEAVGVAEKLPDAMLTRIPALCAANTPPLERRRRQWAMKPAREKPSRKRSVSRKTTSSKRLMMRLRTRAGGSACVARTKGRGAR